VKLKLDNRTLSVLAGVCILLFAAAGYFLLVSPKKGEATRLDEEIAATNVELVAARAAASAAQDDTQPIAVADIFRLATAMPSAPDMPGILLELSRIADETGIRFKSISPQSAVPVGTYLSVPIDVTFDGSFYALSDFLFRLRTLVSVRRGELHAAGRLFSVEAVDFSEAEAGFPTLAAVLKLQAYVYATDPSGTTVPLPADPSAVPPGTDGAAETPAPADGEATAAGATG
jgi:type IV pilus assembly PilO-like protein